MKTTELAEVVADTLRDVGQVLVVALAVYVVVVVVWTLARLLARELRRRR